MPTERPRVVLTNRRLLTAIAALAFGSAVAGLMAVGRERANAEKLADSSAAVSQALADLDRRTDQRLDDLRGRTDQRLDELARQVTALQQDKAALTRSVEELKKTLAQTRSSALATRDDLKGATGVLDVLRPLTGKKWLFAAGDEAGPWEKGVQALHKRLDEAEGQLKKLVPPAKADK